MKIPANSEESINRYLNAVKRNLGAFSGEEQEEILDNLRAHIYSELENRSRGPLTPQDIESVLHDLDAPESYAGIGADFSTEIPSKKRISRRATLGAIIIPFGFFFALLFTPLSASTSPTPVSTWQIIFRYTLLPMSILAPLASTVLGLWGVSEIRNSNGRIYGMPLAVFVSLFYPILILDLILFFVGATVFSDFEQYSIIPLIWLILVLLLDYLIIKTVWRAASKVT